MCSFLAVYDRLQHWGRRKPCAPTTGHCQHPDVLPFVTRRHIQQRLMAAPMMLYACRPCSAHPSTPTGHTGKCWQPAGSCYTSFLTAQLQMIRKLQTYNVLRITQHPLGGSQMSTDLRREKRRSGHVQPSSLSSRAARRDTACSEETGGQ